MNWYERMNKAIGYIEDNLCADISFDEIAKIASQSAVNFQRTFSIVTDISVFEYIRRRRLTLAGFDIQNSNNKVIDIAAKYGYESHEAFTRAFGDFHGASPSNARKNGLPLKVYPRITLLLSIKSDSALECRIERKESFSVYGIESIFTTDEDKHLEGIPMFWKECCADGRFTKLVESTRNPLVRVHSVSDYRETGTNAFPYMLFAVKTNDCNTDGFTEITIPAATWAIFKSEKYTQEPMTNAIQSLVKRIYTEWLPTASYTKVGGYELELYFVTDIDKYYVEAWIRVEPI